MENRIYGYIRVSIKEQNTGRQLDALINAGVDERFIFTDKISGKQFDNRPQYQILKNALREGDTLYIKSIDRLGRNYSQVKDEWKELTQDIKCNIKVIDTPLLDTTIKDRDLTGTFVSNIVLEILSYVSEQERANIKARQREGIERAKKENRHMGRPKTELPENFTEIYETWKSGGITALKAMEILNLKRGTFYNIVKQYESEQAAQII